MIQSLSSLIAESGQLPITSYRDAGDGTPVGINDPRMSLSQLFDFIQSGDATYSGKYINQNTALTLSAVFAATRVLANGVAQMPLLTMRRLGPNKNEQATDHYLYPILKDEVGNHMTAFRWKRLMMTNVVLRGNAIATYDTLGNGRITNIRAVSNDRVKFLPQRDGSLRYLIQQLDANGEASGQWLEYSANRVFHLRGLESADNGIGLSPITLARQAIGLGLATEEYGAKLFSNGALMKGYLKYPGKLSPQGIQNLENSFNLRAGGGNANAHKTPVFEQGMEFVKVSIDPADAQFLESRKFTVLEVCRWMGTKPHMLAELGGANHSNIEQESIEHLRDCLGPWMENVTQEIEHTFLSAQERKTIYVMFQTDVMLRGDKLSRYQAHGIGIQNGFLTPDEARAEEGRNPAANGDQLLCNGTMIPLSVAVAKTEATPAAGTPAATKPEPETDQEDK